MHTQFYRSVFFACCYLCFATHIKAQFPQLHFETLTTHDGLSNNTITCLYQDTEGFLWIGTANGLNKYDGNIFQTYYHDAKDTNSLSGNYIMQILQDDSGIFWIATRDGGLTKYDPHEYRNKQFRQIKHDAADSSSLPSDRMTAICNYDADHLLLSTEKMMLGLLNKKTLRIEYLDFSLGDSSVVLHADMLRPRPKYTMYVHHFEQKGDIIYFSLLSPDVLYTLNKKTGMIRQASASGTTLSIPAFSTDEENVWMASWNGGLYYQPDPLRSASATIKQKKVDGIEAEITAICSWDDDVLLAGSRNSGIYLLNKHTLQFNIVRHDRSDRSSLAANRVTAMLKGSDNIWWFGTNNGLSKYDPLQWQFSATEISNNYEKEITQFSIYENAQHILYVCTSEGFYMKGETDEQFVKKELKYENVKLQPTGIFPLYPNLYILNTETNSYWYEPGSGKIQLLRPARYYNDPAVGYYQTDPRKLGSYQVRFTEADTVAGHALLIFGTMGWGLGVYDETEDTYYLLFSRPEKNAIQNNLVRTLFRDHKNNFWAGTAEGLYKWKKSIPVANDFEIYLHAEDDSNSISGNSVTGMYESADGHLWITTNNGLNEFNGSTFRHYLPADESSRNMYTITADTHQQLWIGVPGGFEIFNTQSRSFHHIELPNPEWSLRYPAQILQRDNGEWIYGAGNNIITFRPDAIQFENQVPPVYLTGFYASDKNIFQTEAFQDLHFSHHQNTFTVTFSSLQLARSNAVNYQYSLKGSGDEAWIQTGSLGKVIFTALPPGNYHLLVKATNAQGQWGEAEQIIAFTIAAPYWQQWWFYVLCVLVAAVIIYMVIKYREKQFMALQRMRNKIANDLHDDVGSALSTINVYSEVAKMKAGKEPAELNTILDKISGISIEMQENMSHIVWSLQPRNDSFEHIILYMKQFANENLEAKNIRTEFSADDKLAELKLTAGDRQNLFLFFKEAIHNIVKYANCTQVTIRMLRNRHKITLSIEDNGAGFDLNEQTNGNGIHSMKERADLLRGNFNIESSPHKGTSVQLDFTI